MKHKLTQEEILVEIKDILSEYIEITRPLTLCTDRFGVHDSSFYRVLSRCVYEKGGQING